MHCNDAPFGTKSRRDEIGTVEDIEAMGQEFGGQGYALQPVMAGGPQVGTAEIGGWRSVGTAVFPTLKYGIGIGLVQLGQSRQQVQDILANAPHLIKRQPAIYPDVHQKIVKRNGQKVKRNSHTPYLQAIMHEKR